MRMTTILLLAAAVLAVLVAVLYPRTAGASPAVGDPAPAFTLVDQTGATRSLSDYDGHWLVLYFYPKDDTPGCTTEACSFRDDIFQFREMGVEVVGVSLDDVESHKAFAEKYSLPFTLLSDADQTVAKAYGVLTKSGPMSYAKRETFVIAPDGTVAKHYAEVKAAEHSDQVLQDVKALMAD